MKLRNLSQPRHKQSPATRLLTSSSRFAFAAGALFVALSSQAALAQDAEPDEDGVVLENPSEPDNPTIFNFVTSDLSQSNFTVVQPPFDVLTEEELSEGLEDAVREIVNRPGLSQEDRELEISQLFSAVFGGDSTGATGLCQQQLDGAAAGLSLTASSVSLAGSIAEAASGGLALAELPGQIISVVGSGLDLGATILESSQSDLPFCEGVFTGTISTSANVNANLGVSAFDGAITLGNPDGQTRSVGIALGGGALSGAGSPGQLAIADNITAIAIGSVSEARGEGAVAFGLGARALDDNAIAVGIFAQAEGGDSIAIGAEALATDASAIAIGGGANASGTDSTAISTGAQATGANSVAIGRISQATGLGATAVGFNSRATADNGAAFGSGAIASGSGSVALGLAASSQNQFTTALGALAVAEGSQATALGATADASGELSTAIGRGADASGNFAVALGNLANTNGAQGIAIGDEASAIEAGAISLGGDAIADGEGGVAIGRNSDVAAFGVGLGEGATAGGISVALGASADASETLASAIGANSQAVGLASTALGAESRATALASVALGGGSLADEEFTVSVGSANQQRRIVNLAEGTDTTDAVNVGQLNDAIASVAAGANPFIAIDTAGLMATTGASETVAIGGSSAANGANSVALGSGSIADEDNTVSFGAAGSERRLVNVAQATSGTDAVNLNQLNTALAGVAGGDPFVDVNSGGAPADAQGSEAIAIGGGSVASDEVGVAIGAMSSASGSNSVALGTASVADRAQSVSVGSAGNERQITNLAAATQTTDAVNLGQLNSAIASVAATGNPFFAANSNGSAADASGAEAIAVGGNSSATNEDSIAIGQGAVATGAGGVAIGSLSVADETLTVSVGRTGLERRIVNVADATGSNDAVNLGQLNAALAGVTVGGNPFLNVNSTGGPAVATGDEAVALGGNTSAAGENAVALGNGADASGANSVALGNGSTATQANVVSVGAAGSERRIVNLAAGTADTDAVNLGQLNAVSTVANDAAAQNLVQDGLIANNTSQVTMALDQNTVQDTLIASNTALANQAISENQTQQGQIDSNTANVAQNTTNIATNASNIASNSDDILDNNIAIAVLQTENTMQDAAIADNVSDIAQNASDIADNASEIADNAADIADNAVLVASNSDAIAINTVEIGDNRTEISVNRTVATAAASDAATALEQNALQQTQLDLVNGLVGDALAQNVVQDQRLDILEAGLGALNNSVNEVDRNANGGIAAAVALGGSFLPPDANFSINFNLATYRGEQGFAGSLVGRVSEEVYITGGIAGSTVRGSTTGRVGIAIGW